MYRGGERRGYTSGERKKAKKQKISRLLPHPPPPQSRFHTHPRWPPVTQSARYRRSYGKIADCEQSIIIHFKHFSVFDFFKPSVNSSYPGIVDHIFGTFLPMLIQLINCIDINMKRVTV